MSPRTLSLLATMILSAGTLAADSAGDLQGRYERPVTVRDLSAREDVEMLDYLEIERKGPTSLFFVYQSWHTNGHSCQLWGEANEREKGVFEYAETADATLPGEEACRVHIHADSEHVFISDVGDHCQASHCGVRGYIGTDVFSRKARLPLTGPVTVPW